MPRVSELKRGSIVEIDGDPHTVESLSIQTPSARGGASLYKIRFRNLATKQKLDQSLKGDNMLNDASFERREVQYSYQQQNQYVFTDLADYSEISISESDLEYEKGFITDDIEGLQALVSDGRVLGIELPPVVDIEVTDTGPSMKGASATARTKPATLSTGLVVHVPEYLATGEVVRVDTRTGKFLSRA